MKKTFLTLALLTIGVFTYSLSACTNFIVTKGASQDGSCFVTYSADSHTLYGELYFWPAQDHPAGSMMDVIEWDSGNYMGQIPQVTHTYQVVGNINEHQLAISETTYGGLKQLEKPNGIIDYGSLIYITLQRAKNAREAIKIISELLDNYGYASSGESLSIIDPHEAWIFELISKGEEMKDAKGRTLKGWTKGAVWVARRIPDGYVSGHANQARITTFPIANGKTSITNKEFQKIFNPEVETVYSHDVISFAKLAGLYPAQGKDEDFSFAHTYAPLDFGAARFCEARVWAFFYRVNPELARPYEKYARGEDLESKEKMPLWIKPVKKISVRDMMDYMRDHYEGTSMDMTKDLGAGPYSCPYRWRPMTWSLDGKNYIHERATATQQTGFSFVAQTRSWLPDKIGGILWFSVDDVGMSCYVPMFAGINKVPMPYRVGNGSMAEYSPTSAFWTFTKVSNFVYTRYSDMIVHVREKQDKWELGTIQDIASKEKEWAALLEKDEVAGVAQITNYTNQVAQQVVDEWSRLFEYLLVKYHDGNIKVEEHGQFKTEGDRNPQVVFPKQPRYPDRWYRMIVDDCGTNISAPDEK
ncbi:MAG TPA: C69 family dipeptidase [Bacteroidales bacterium]|nr:C69 family dipeptidase [Bacteroidales bacterium]HOH22791.1 C69 family dipeptidase [Bacteroidales bacterium]HPZ04132.1 C69 family dipeptidase [Bacteroidales bacterium]HQB75202.1 C69 family dipeptidase [Bacteroidales bacterium]